MSTDIFGLTVAALADAPRAPRTVDHAVTLVDDASRVIVVVDQRGRVTMRMARRSGGPATHMRWQVSDGRRSSHRRG